MLFDGLADLFNRRSQFDRTSQDVIQSWMETAREVEQLNEIKGSKSWQLIEQKIKDELAVLITAAIQNLKDERGGRINALLQVLMTTNTKTTSENLNEAIADFLKRINN